MFVIIPLWIIGPILVRSRNDQLKPNLNEAQVVENVPAWILARAKFLIQNIIGIFHLKMSQPIPVDILSDDDECGYLNTSDPSATGKEAVCIDLSTPVESYSKKKPRISEPNDLNPSTTMVFIIDDDPTPLKHSFGSASTASMVAETPPISSHCSKLKEASITKCSRGSFGMFCFFFF